MKKYWQVKPWFFIILILVVAGGLLYVFGSKNVQVFPENAPEVMTTASMGMDYAAEPNRIQVMDGSYDKSINVSDRMIIKTASLSVVVEDVQKSVEDIVSYIEKKDGFLVTSNLDKSGLSLNGYISVRVPSALLEETMAYIKEMGDVKSEQVDGRDITEEYVDLEAKLGNLKATENQFLEIMKGAVKIEDVLAVQRELSYVRENIDSIEGRMKYLNESVDLSSISVYLATDPSNLPVVDKEDQWKPFAVFKDALRSLLDTGKGIVNGLIWLGVYLPIFIVVLLVAWAVRSYIRRKRK